ncbi:formate dehydrogenase subunit gamma [Formicincola oecophyllae]|uniref:Formate dehydrogenase subunit gamma n=2 Tax=Formicincola oecophyllae TaxID=2558361 RepID=A0A4Y6UAZ8_9PROT|nr:formate dehydrogenase subunit gamma [Formicincola oecophyllae]
MPDTDKKVILRCDWTGRALHWLNVCVFGLAVFSGLSFYFPSLDWMGHLLGPGQLARTLHPFMGIAAFCCLMFMFMKFVHHNIPNKYDVLWFKNIIPILENKHNVDLHIGKYNAGQKLLFWCLMSLIWVLLLSGLVIWRKYFANLFPQSVVQIAVLVHSMAATIIILLVMGHIYFGFWVKGSITGMVTGWVTRRWARVHHDRWFEEVMRDEADEVTARIKHKDVLRPEGVPPSSHPLTHPEASLKTIDKH